MHSAAKFDVSTLNWVKGEIDETLKQARIALESFAESSDDANQLKFCIAYLHQVAGTLQMVELHGAAGFAGEIELLATALLEGQVADRDTTFDVLMRSILQLPDYLESLQNGKSDNALLLLPLHNELRRARGEQQLSEATLFSPNMAVMPDENPNAAKDLKSVARKLRSYYLLALLRLLRGENSAAQVKILNAVADKLFAATNEPHQRQWLWIFRGFLEALRDANGPLDLDQKLVLARCEQLFKRVALDGEDALDEEHTAPLNRAMLLQVAKSASDSVLIRELRTSFHLDDLVPEAVQAGEALLGGFNAELKRTVSSDVLAELARVKESFDIFVRSDRTEVASLDALASTVSTIAETLVLLHHESLAHSLREQAHTLRRLSSGTQPADDGSLMGVAAAILSVESTLGDWGSSIPLEKADDMTGQLSADEVGEQAESEHRRVIRQVMKEARDGVIRIREAISHYLLAPTDKAPLAPVPGQLHEVVGSLTMLSYRRVAQVLRGCGAFIKHDLLEADALPSGEKLDALADAIMSIEYYLEAFVQSRVHPASVLDVAERGVAALGYDVDHLSEESDAPYSHRDDDTDDSDETLVTGEEIELSLPVMTQESTAEPFTYAPVSADLTDVISMDDSALPPLTARPMQPMPSVVPKPAIADVDDEIVGIFIEEAEEELINIGRLAPMWSHNPADDEALRDLRRSFHTLKGSGRLVGASALGEFAWAFENMLNRVIDHTVRPGPALFDMLDQAQHALRQLLDNFRSGSALDDGVEMLREAAHEMAQPGGMQLPPSVQRAVVSTPPEVVVRRPETPPAQIEQLEMDDALLEIYEKESEGHLEELQKFIDNYATGLHRANEPLIRALHTLTGSSRMAGVQPVAQFTTLLEKYAKTVQLERMPMAEEAVALLGECITFTRQVMLHLQQPAANPLPSNETLLERATALYATVQHAEERVSARPEEGLAAVAEPELQTASADAEESTLSFVLGEEAPQVATPKSSPDDFARALELLDESLPTPGGAPAERAPVAELPLEIALPESSPVEPFTFSDKPLDVVSLAPAATPSDYLGEYDAELLDIFLEEAGDILNESEETLHAWVKSPDDRSLVEALQRQLHTLKGGARMAGIRAIGDLGHSLESTFEAVVEGRLERSKRMMNLLQLAHDRLVVMVEQVRQHQPLSSGDDLINQIYALGRGEEEQVEALPLEPITQEPPLPATRKEPQLRVVVNQEIPAPVYTAQQLAMDPLELLLSTGQERIARIVERGVSWRHAPDELSLMREVRHEAAALMQESGAAIIVELTELAQALVELLKAVDDGYVPVADKMFNLLDATGERLTLIFGQLTQRISLSNGLYLASAIRELIKSAVAEHNALYGEQERTAALRVVREPAAKELLSAAPQAVEATEQKERSVAAEQLLEQESGLTDDNRRQGARVQHEMVRVRSDLLDNMVNFAGEVSIYRSRVEQQLGAIRFNIEDLDQTVVRLREQVRQFDIETEAQIDSRFRETAGQEYEDFDPLEFDRFTHMQQLSRSMMESLNDLMSIEDMMLNLSRESETLLLQQSRVNTELQETLMHTRMMPLVEHAPRLRRIVRQTCAELNKQANLSFHGADVEMDRNVVDRILAPLEHMLRNSVAHGIEQPEARTVAGKPAEGSITVALAREGSEIVIRVSDDGGGINLDAVRKKAIDRGLMSEGARISDKDVMRFILESGFSTAETLSQIAGRGVGMDVVASEIRQLGGVLEIDSQRGKGTFFTIRLPLTLSVSRALLVYAGEDILAVPLLSITGIERIDKNELERLLTEENPQYRWVGHDYALMHLSRVLGISGVAPVQEGDKVSLLLAQSGELRAALAVDGLIGNREIVVKPLGAQLSTLPDISGATILADGNVALIIDLPALMRRGLAKRVREIEQAEAQVIEVVPTVMVVDDSITVRKVTERLLKRHNIRCVTAKDGVDALTVLEDVAPDLMLLDIEMPRMDGYELATHLRGSARFRNLPIIMITSRTGDKHRQRALDIGVNVYMGKPYTETDLMANIEQLLHKKLDDRDDRGLA